MNSWMTTWHSVIRICNRWGKLVALRVGNAGGPALRNAHGPGVGNADGPTLGKACGPGWGMLVAHPGECLWPWVGNTRGP